eukprot:14116379-Alexandrium_andersonii.AAC.1
MRSGNDTRALALFRFKSRIGLSLKPRPDLRNFLTLPSGAGSISAWSASSASALLVNSSPKPASTADWIRCRPGATASPCCS